MLQCLRAKRIDRLHFPQYPLQFFFTVPDCPCTLFQAAVDFRYMRVLSLTQRLCYSFIWRISGPTNLCCYSTNFL